MSELITFTNLAKERISQGDHFFNNFTLRFSRYSWEELEEASKKNHWISGDARFYFLHTGLIDTTFREFLDEVNNDPKISIRPAEELPPEYRNSELYKSQTPREFYSILDQAIEEAGLSREKLFQLIDNREIRTLNDTMTGPLIDLLEKGYSFQDLFA